MIRLQLSATNGLQSRLIQFLTASVISHVDIVLPDGRLLGALPSDGVQVRPANYSRWTRILRVTIPSTADQERRFFEAAEGQIGKKYDWSGIFNFFTQRNWRESDKWFCSELVAYALEAASIPAFNPVAPVRKIVPDAFLLSPLCNYSFAEAYKCRSQS